MLEHLEIKDLALIDALSLDLSPGLNLVTGETGSGKSILLDALGFVLGERASVDLIRGKAELMSVNARFEPPKAWRKAWKPWFEAKGLPWDEDQVLLKRELARSGKGRAWINGESVTAGVLAELGQGLADFHGQHDHQALLRIAEHRSLLDRFGGLEKPLEAVKQAFGGVQAKRQALEGPQGGLEGRRRQLDFLAFQLGELAELAPAQGQWDPLQSAAGLQASAGKRSEALAAAVAGMGADEGGALASLAQGLAALKRLAQLDPRQEALLQRAQALQPELEDLSAQLRTEAEALELDPAEMERLQARLHQWESLARKHQVAPEALPGHWQRLKQEHEALRFLLEDEAGLRQALEQALQAYGKLAAELSQARAEAARRLEKALSEALSALVGPQTIFAVRLAAKAEASLWGSDEVEFLFAANAGEDAKPLARIASGGELSRVTLAIKSVLSQAEGAPCLIFDEIDAGISGRVGAIVGQEILKLAAGHQVLCITHLPQIACLPARHFKVSKAVQAGQTLTRVELLSSQGREEEVASLLGSEVPGPSALAHAQALLAAGPAVRS